MDQIKQLQKLAGVSEASVNISLNGTNSAEIQDLMGIFQKDARAPLPPTGIAKPPISISPMDGPDLPDVKAPMGLDGPLPPMPPPMPIGMDSPLDLDKGPMDDGPSSCSTCGGMHSEEEECGEGTDWDNSPKEKYQDSEFMTKDISGGINGPKDPKDIRVKDPSSMEESTFKKQLWQALQEKYFTEFDGRDGQVNEYPNEEQTFSGRSDRTYFIVPNEDDYTDIQDDSRFAGDIEVPDENADIMALPNSKARKLKMMYGNKVIDLGTDYDEAKEKMDRKARRRHLAGISRTKAGGSAGRRSAEGQEHPEEGNAFSHAVRKAKMDGKKKGDKIPHPDKDKDEVVIQSQHDGEIDDIRRLSGLGEGPKKKNSLGADLRRRVGDKLGLSQTLMSKGNKWSNHQIDQAFDFIAKRPRMEAVFKRLDYPNQMKTMEKVLNKLNRGQAVKSGGTAMNTTAQPQRGTTATMGNPNMGGVA
jgi:hypothetical protein